MAEESTQRLRFDCTCGSFVVEVIADWAPIGAQRFLDLVNDGFYDGARFFRVVTKPRPFIVQFGLAADPGLTAKWDINIKDDPVKQSNAEGTLTFATAGPNTRTTQLFINLGDNDFLDGQGFSPFGRVVEGMDSVRAISDEYGESPDQNQIKRKGNAYAEAKFPNLDYIKSVEVLAD